MKEIIPDEDLNNYREFGWNIFIILKRIYINLSLVHINQQDNDIVKNMVLLVVVQLILHNIHNDK